MSEDLDLPTIGPSQITVYLLDITGNQQDTTPIWATVNRGKRGQHTPRTDKDIHEHK